MFPPGPPVRPKALTIPNVTEKENCSPSGLPIAIAKSPTATLSESPSAASGYESFVLKETIARSLRSSLPTSAAEYSFPFLVEIFISDAPSTTWWLVRA